MRKKTTNKRLGLKYLFLCWVQVPGLPANSPNLAMALVCCYKQTERRALIVAICKHIDHQIPRGLVQVESVWYFFTDFLMADYKLACIIFGTLGQNALFNCLHCLGRFGRNVLGQHETSRAILRDPKVMEAVGTIAEPYEIINKLMDVTLANVRANAESNN